MIIKKYIVNNMNEAMVRIRYELGKDAVIIGQRKVRKPGFKGYFSKKIIEVTAAIESKTNIKEPITENNMPMEESIQAIKKALENNSKKEDIKTVYENNNISKNNTYENKSYDNNESVLNKNKNMENSILLKEMSDMKHTIFSMLENIKDEANNGVAQKSEMIKILENSDVDKELLEYICNCTKAYTENLMDKEKIKKFINENIHIGMKQGNTIVLVGPTGVGKTTTIAKLAGRLALIEKKKVGLITVDTYRIGAVEQLKTYADIMNIPFKVVFSIKEMENSIESMRDCDVVLIDTTGRSSKNTMQISELRAFIDKAKTENIHLVISSTTKSRDIDSILEGYRALNYNNIIITKLDETTTYGSLLNILLKGNKPLSYVTVGQNVPDDIKTLTKDNICSLVLGEDSI